MWKIVPYVVALSVAMNLAFGAVWITKRAESQSHREPAEPTEQTTPYPPGKEQCEISCPLHRKLKTTREQWSRIEPRLVEFQRDTQTLCGEIGLKRNELIELLSAPEADRAAIEVKLEEVLDGQRRMQNLVVEHLLAEKGMLSPEQQEALFRLLRQHPGCSGHGSSPRGSESNCGTPAGHGRPCGK